MSARSGAVVGERAGARYTTFEHPALHSCFHKSRNRPSVGLSLKECAPGLLISALGAGSLLSPTPLREPSSLFDAKGSVFRLLARSAALLCGCSRLCVAIEMCLLVHTLVLCWDKAGIASSSGLNYSVIILSSIFLCVAVISESQCLALLSQFELKRTTCFEACCVCDSKRLVDWKWPAFYTEPGSSKTRFSILYVNRRIEVSVANPPSFISLVFKQSSHRTSRIDRL